MKKPGLIKLIHFLVGAIFFLVPLFFTKQFVFAFAPSKTFLFYALVEIAFFVWLYVAISTPAYRPPKSPVLISGAVFLGLYTLAGIFGVSPEISFWSSISRMSGLILIYHVAALILVMSSSIKDNKSWRRIISASVFSAVIVAIFSYFESAGFNVLNLSSAEGSTLGNSSYAGVYLAINIFFALYLFEKNEDKKFKLGSLISAGLIFLSPILFKVAELGNILADPASVLGVARATSVGLFLALLIYVAIAYRKKYIRYLATFTVVLFLVALSMLVIENSPIQKGLAEFDGGNRFLFWRAGADGIAEKPILGWGPENYQFALYKNFPSELYSAEHGLGVEANVDKPHNSYLELAVTGGFLSLAAYLAMIFFVFRRATRLDGAKRATIVAALSAYLIANLYLFDMLVSYIMLALLIAFSINKNEGYTTIKGSGRLLLVSIALFVLSTYYIVLTPISQQQILSKGFTIPNDIDYNSLFSMSPNGRQSMMRFLMVKSVNGFSPYQVYIDNMSRIREAATPYLEKYDDNYRLISSFVRASILEASLTKNGELLTSLIEYENRMFVLSPNNPEPYWARAQRQYAEGFKNSAIETLREADRRWPSLTKSVELIEIIESGETPPLFF